MTAETSITRENILKSAKSEFVAHGFSGASLRTIAAGAGVTTGALYRHFANKADLFDVLVSPCLNELMARYDEAAHEFMGTLDHSGMDWSSSEESLLVLVNYLYDHLEIFRLLLLAEQKTAEESFAHLLVEMEVEMTLQYMDAAKAKGYAINEISREEVHLFANAQFSVLFEMILHDIPRDQASGYAKKLYRFFSAGWRELFMGS